MEHQPPLQQLCNIIKAIATGGEADPDLDVGGAAGCVSGAGGGGGSADLALGIAKLMKVKKADDDLSCFICHKKCRSTSKFLAHFQTHIKNSESSCSSSDNEDNSADSPSSENLFATATSNSKSKQRHLLLRKGSGGVKRCKPRNGGGVLATAKGSCHDPADGGDSGCHSVESRSELSSSSTLEESDCPGDSESESSDAEHGDSSGVLKGLGGGHRAKWRKQRKTTVTVQDRLSLAEKQLESNETEGLICLTCLKRFSNIQNLRRHLRLHISRDSTTPDIERCSNGSAGDDLDGDFAEVGRYFCDWCPARFDNRSAARIHESTHKGQETKCYVCDKTYADRYSLRYHLRTHGIGRQIRCEYCNKSFSKPSRLEAHVKSHHNNIRDFKCSECNKAFKTRNHLANHFRQHSGERPYCCPVCGDSFRHKVSLLAHQRSHEGVRPYCCEVCGKTFREPSTLKAHSRVHSGDKPYKCNLCDKSFTQRAGLNYHKQSHKTRNDTCLLSEGNRKPHKCKLCHFSTMKNTSLASHYKSVHGGHDETQQVAAPSLDMIVNGNKLPSFDNLKAVPSSPSHFHHQPPLPTQQQPQLPLPSLSPSAASTTSSHSIDSCYSKESQDRDSTPPLSPPSPALGGNNNSGSMEGYFSGNGGTSGAPGSDSQHQMDYFSMYGGTTSNGTSGASSTAAENDSYFGTYSQHQGNNSCNYRSAAAAAAAYHQQQQEQIGWFSGYGNQTSSAGDGQQDYPNTFNNNSHSPSHANSFDHHNQHSHQQCNGRGGYGFSSNSGTESHNSYNSYSLNAYHQHHHHYHQSHAAEASAGGASGNSGGGIYHQHQEYSPGNSTSSPAAQQHHVNNPGTSCVH